MNPLDFLASGWLNRSLLGTDQPYQFKIAADTYIDLLRLDTQGRDLDFGFESLSEQTWLSEFQQANASSLDLEKIRTDRWLQTEGVSLGGRRATPISADNWRPIARDSSGELLSLEEVTLTGNSALARFSGGVEAVYSVGGSGLLANAIPEGPQVVVEGTVRRLANYNNGIAIYEADPLNGAVDGLSPGDPGYLQAALRDAKESGLVFSAFQLPENGSIGSINLNLSPDKNYGFLLLVDGDESNLFSSYSSANPDNAVQVVSFTTSDGSLALGFEDQLVTGESDQDFNDVILTLPITTSTDILSEVNYRIGSLFPTLEDGSPNLILSSGLELRTIDGESRVVSSLQSGTLDTPMRISSDPVRIPGIDRFLRDWFIPQLTDTANSQSLFNAYKKGVLSKWTTHARNRSMEDLLKIGYVGPGNDQSATNDDYWNAVGVVGSDLYKAASDSSNYKPAELWDAYDGSTTVFSRFDTDALLQRLEALTDPEANPNPDLWYPSMLYTFGVPGEGTSYPAPVLMMQPGDGMNLNFTNDIKVDGLNEEQNQAASLVSNSTYGNAAGDGLGALNAVNYHLHGSHTNPGGFGDNVVARYTTGQQWTTEIDLPADHGQGSYWYHPHYHPSVNQMVYGGMSGPFQVGDPLSKIPLFKDIPRNWAVLKTMDVGIDAETGKLRLDGFDNLGGVVNRMTMVTVNGEFQPTAEAGEGGWQAITLSNQTNQAFHNISLIHTDSDGNRTTLPLYLYGEDGHQYPQIRAATDGIFGASGASNQLPTGYTQAVDLLSLPPAKRVDVLVYLPEGKTEMASTYSFEQDGVDYTINNAGSYPDLTEINTGFGSKTGAGPLALFNVEGGQALPTTAELDAVIAQANAGIDVQQILPTTSQADYDPLQVPSVDLFAQDADGSDLWDPIRQRQFNWTKGTLVGPASEYDAATVELLKHYSMMNDGATYEPYTSLPVGKPGVDNWLGYNNPFLINDHVFPYGNMTIAQLGTIEEWVNRNWSINSPSKYIGHPFHIHINDYQVKDSDTELQNKRNLEDTTSLNSSGYEFYDPAAKEVVSLEPQRGEFHSIPEAQDPEKIASLATFGANDQTIRMLYQDYLGTYVFHCHILPHEDAGMMQIVTVVENTDSSWLVEAQGFTQNESGVRLYQAQTFDSVQLQALPDSGQTWTRAQAGDLGADFVQDIALAAGGGGEAGIIELFDGAALLRGETLRTSRLTPYADSSLAPWVFIEDFSGDGQRDLVTAGFDQVQSDVVNLKDLEIKAFLPGEAPGSWDEQFNFDPFDDISLMAPHSVMPRMGLSADQVSVAMADMNLDNFQDVAIAYAVEGGVRLVVIDGAALSLMFQTGEMEGGFFADSNVLADAVFLDSGLSDLSQLVLTSGFNSYAQSALENLVLTTQSSAGSQQFTLQLQAGHFIATNLPDSSESGGHGGHGGHGGAGLSPDERITNLRNNSLPLFLVDELQLANGTEAVTPTISAGLGHGGTLLDGHAVIAQGNEVNGNASNSDILINTTQQLVIPLDGLNLINADDLTGIVDTTSSSTFTAEQVQQRYQLTSMTYLAYTGKLLWPSALASQAASILGTGEQASALVTNLLSSPAYAGEIEALYGGPLADQSVNDIVEIAYSTLYKRSATASELQSWQDQVSAGLDQTLLPQAILQSTQEADRFRVALLSDITQWTALQWGTTAEVSGSYGQGLVGDEQVSNQLDALASSLGSYASFEDAQQGFDLFTTEALQELIGTPVSKSGFF
ncbi:multicopper oxidase domain-containing protein [Synechococcus sp. CS-197]|uniref:multicopper oxidase domain-containing protein n=1 Tax=Synechococcus sp. CS-197 TaxID=2847985 RepID=UPI00223AE24E|nr:multicopper oxidase domain-containing protein [Synechococcus sp. CS-197]MCT0251805.1 multicopper oxidase domain-containing protein [Synechococcus sp. CS-197]